MSKLKSSEWDHWYSWLEEFFQSLNASNTLKQSLDIFLTVLGDVISKTGRFLSKRAFPREEKLKTLIGKQKRISELCSTQKRGKICESIFWQHQFMTFEWDFLLACCSIPVACSVSRHCPIYTKLSAMCLLC